MPDFIANGGGRAGLRQRVIAEEVLYEENTDFRYQQPSFAHFHIERQAKTGPPIEDPPPDHLGQRSAIPLTRAIRATSGQVTNMTLGSGDTNTFGFDANTGRPTSYSFHVDGQTETGTLTNNTDGDVGKLVLSDPFNSANTQTCTYSYDDLNRISTNNFGTAWGAQYTYDAFGNISKSTIAGSPGTSFMPTYSATTNRYSSIPGSTPTYDANGNLTADGFHTYGWDAEGNLITVDGVTGTFDALARRVELGASPNYSQMIFSPADPRHPLGTAAALSVTGFRLPLPNGGEVTYGPSELANYRNPNWQGSQVLLSVNTATPPTFGGAFTPFGEKYAVYPSGYNGYFAGCSG